MRDLVYIDIETDNLLIQAKKLWVICCIDMNTNEEFSFKYNELDKFEEFMSNVNQWVGHNILGFDRPCLYNLTGLDLGWEKCIDTLILSKLFNPMTTISGVKNGKPYSFRGQKRTRHSLGSFGAIFKFPKLDFHDFSKYTEEMEEYCMVDCRLGVKVYHYLMKERGGNSQESIDLEHYVTHLNTEQQMYGFLIDRERATKLYQNLMCELKELTEEVTKNIPPYYKFKMLKKLRRKPDGSIYSQDLRTLKRYKRRKVGEDTYRLYVEVEFNMNSTPQLVYHMTQAGWKPVDFTPKGSPQLTEANLATLPASAPQVYQSIQRISMLKARTDNIGSWLDHMDNNDRVHGQMDSLGAWTHRMAHRHPNTANIAGVQSPYGKECRECWTVPDGYTLVGTDASGIQGRLLAHYVNDPEYTAKVLSADIHTVHRDLLGLPATDAGRSMAKMWFYAWVFGMGDGNLGKILGGGAKEGAAANKLFEERIKGLAAFNKQTKLDYKRGYMVGLDGRHIGVPSQHKVRAAYLQGGEAVVMKKAKTLWHEETTQLDSHCVADVHDEWQTEALLAHAKQVGTSQVAAIVKAGEMLKLRIPLDGESKYGNNWYETH